MNDPTPAATAALNVRVNGQPHALPAPCTLAELMARLGRDAGSVATAVNGGFVARAARAQHALRDGDDVACFQLIVGG